jgi:hypothetical protein
MTASAWHAARAQADLLEGQQAESFFYIKHHMSKVIINIVGRDSRSVKICLRGFLARDNGVICSRFHYLTAGTRVLH